MERFRRWMAVWTCAKGHPGQPDDTMICLTCMFGVTR